MKNKIEAALNKLPVLGSKLSVVLMGMFLLMGGTVSAVIVNELGQSINSSGNVGEPFTTTITAASVGSVDDPNTLSGANTVAGSSAETMTLDITNNANKDIDAYLQIACSSADDSLTADYMVLEFDGVTAGDICDITNVAYYYRTNPIETFVGGATESPVVSYNFPITPTGYYSGDYTCSVSTVATKQC